MDSEQATKALQHMPRYDRARVQKMQAVFEIAGRIVKRMTRRYWLIDGTAVKLNDAVEMLTGV